MWKPMLLILIAWTLTGCASGPPQTPGIFRPVPAHLVADCPPPPPAPEKFTGAHLLDNHVRAMRAYWDCRAMQRDLAEWVKRGVVRDE
jgi:hypothetical protein